MSDLDDILSDEPIETQNPVEDVTEEESPEQEKAEEQPEEAPEEAKEPEKEPEQTMVPLAALQEVRGELKETKTLLQQLQSQQPRAEPQPAPDMFEDPQGYQQHQAHMMQAATQNIRLDLSEEMAVGQYGRDVVDAAFGALKQSQDRAAYQAVMQARSPYMELVKWHQRQQIAQEIGDDPAAWKEAQRAAIRAEVEAELKANQVAENVTQVPAAPGSLASEPNLGTRKAPEWGGPMTLDDILG